MCNCCCFAWHGKGQRAEPLGKAKYARGYVLSFAKQQLEQGNHAISYIHLPRHDKEQRVGLQL